MVELGSFVVGTGGLLLKDPRQNKSDDQLHIPETRPGFWNVFLQRDGDLICAVILIHDCIDPQKTQPEWQDSIGSVSLADDSIGIWNQTKFEAHHDELIPDFGTLMSEDMGYCVNKHGVMVIAGATTTDCEVYTDVDKKERVIAVKVVFWDEKENWGASDEEDEEDEDNPSEFGVFGAHDHDEDEIDD